MRTAEELLRLGTASLDLWRRGFTRLGTWYCLGWAVHTGCLFGSALLGPYAPLPATLLFVLGVVALVCSLVLMLHSLEGRLRAPALLRPGAGAVRRGAPTIPPLVWEQQAPLPVVGAAIGPFLAVYAVWGLVDEQVTLLFSANIALRGTYTEAWSVNLSRVSFYLGLAVVTFLLRRVVDLLQRRLRRAALGLVALVLEALWVFASFLALASAAGDVVDWLASRRVLVAVRSGWTSLLQGLPDWRLPFDLTLPEALAGAVEVAWSVLLPGVWQAVLLPLVWLALAATVFGWRDFTGQRVLTGGRTADVLRRARAADGLGPLNAVTSWATADLRDKYLPVLHALRLLWAAGPPVVVAYLVWTTLLGAAAAWTSVLVRTLAGDVGPEWVPLYSHLEALLHGLVFTTLQVAGYAAAFDRTLLALRDDEPPAADRVSAG